MSLAERFHNLFPGLERCHGQYVVPETAKPDANGKIVGKPLTIMEPATVALWERHLEGAKSFGLGVVPICEDNTGQWGAIDVDVYPLDNKKLNEEVQRFGLPLVLCVTKSGGAHLYLFTSEPVPAELIRGKLMEWSVILGYTGVEVFPKQTRLASPNDQGNWINMPYQAGARSVRYALDPKGEGLTPEQFLDYAETRKLSLEALKAFKPTDAGTFDDILVGAPPCLIALARRGIPAGTRNNALFNFAVYLKKRFGDDWPDHLTEVNQQFLKPPLGHQEIAATVKSVSKKNYSFKCKEQPIVAVCNRQICLTREFGIGAEAGGDDPGVVFGEIVKIDTDPVAFIWDVNGARLELGVDELMDQRRFHKRCIEELSIWPRIIKAGLWQTTVQERLDRATTIKPPDDATPKGQFFAHVDAFLNGRAQAKSVDEITMGRPFHDAENRRVCFRSVDLLNYLLQRKFKFSERQVFLWLRDVSVGRSFVNVKGRGINFWFIPEMDKQQEPYDVPGTRSPNEF